MQRPSFALLLSVGLAFLACGGDSGTNPGVDGGGGTGGGGTGSGRVVKENPSYAADIQEIWDRRGCSQSQCHGSAMQGGLDLREGNSHGELFNVPAQGEEAVRVIPGNAQDSYLVIKLEGRQTFGDQMPQSGTPLDSIDLANVRNWVDQGAENN